MSPRRQPLPATPSLPSRVAATVLVVLLAALLVHVAPPVPVDPEPGDVPEIAEAAPFVSVRLVDIRFDEAQGALAGSLLAARDQVARTRLAGWLVESTTGDWRRGGQAAFLREVAPYALAAALDEPVLPSLLLAQAAHESGWGRSRIAREAQNLYGHARGCGWRVYPSWAEAVLGHARLLGRSPRYALARAAGTDWSAALRGLAPAYAADPDYVARISTVVRQWKLDRWDTMFARR